MLQIGFCLRNIYEFSYNPGAVEAHGLQVRDAIKSTEAVLCECLSKLPGDPHFTGGAYWYLHLSLLNYLRLKVKQVLISLPLNTNQKKKSP